MEAKNVWLCVIDTNNNGHHILLFDSKKTAIDYFLTWDEDLDLNRAIQKALTLDGYFEDGEDKTFFSVSLEKRKVQEAKK